MLKKFHPNIDVYEFSVLLTAELDRLYPLPKLKIRLRVKTLYNRKERDPHRTTKFRDRIQAVHIDSEGTH